MTALMPLATAIALFVLVLGLVAIGHEIRSTRRNLRQLADLLRAQRERTS